MDAEKRQKLKNDNIFISPYRLCVRNIPVQVDDKKLASMYKDAVGDKSAVITEVCKPLTHSLFTEIGREIISTAIFLPSVDSRRVVVKYKRKYVHKVLVKCLVKLAQEKSVVR